MPDSILRKMSTADLQYGLARRHRKLAADLALLSVMTALNVLVVQLPDPVWTRALNYVLIVAMVLVAIGHVAYHRYMTSRVMVELARRSKTSNFSMET